MIVRNEKIRVKKKEKKKEEEEVGKELYLDISFDEKSRIGKKNRVAGGSNVN